MKTVSINSYKQFLTEIKTEATAQNWTVLRDLETNNSREIFLQSPNGAIIGLKENTDNNNYFNILLNYAISFDNALSFWQQSGSIYNFPDSSTNSNDRAPTLNLHNNSMNLFLFVNVNRIIIVVNALSKYVSAYIGRYKRNGTEGQIPNNLFAGGSSNLSIDTSLSSNSLSAFYTIKRAENCASVAKDESDQNLKLTSNSAEASSLTIHPFSYYTDVKQDVVSKDNQRILYPSILTYVNKNLGELDGVYYISSINNLAPENELTIDNETYKVFIDTSNTALNYNFFAIKI